MANMSAQNAFAVYNTGVPSVQKEVENMVAQGLVRQVYIEEGKEAEFKGKAFLAFLTKMGLVTHDEAAKAKKSGGSGLGRGYTKEVDAISGGAATAIKELVKQLNETLKGTDYLAFFYTKNKAAEGSKPRTVATV